MSNLTVRNVVETYARRLAEAYPDVAADILKERDEVLERLDPEAGLIEDGRKWRTAEAEGHVVTFSETGYGLRHPPSCRPDLIGCQFNAYLARRGEPDEEPGTYQMFLRGEVADYLPSRQ